MKHQQSGEAGFTVLEVAIASVISMVGLVFLASLFTVGIAQNRLVKQYTTATSLAQMKLEELNAVDQSLLIVGGGLNTNSTTDVKQTGYCDTVYVDPTTGTVTTVLPTGATPIYDRYWSIQNDPGGLTTALLLSVRVVARQPSIGHTAEESVLVSARSL